MGINYFEVNFRGKGFCEKKGLGSSNPSPEMVAVQGLEPRTSRI
jgi:hypothetical protein